jgi:hypothetical protein
MANDVDAVIVTKMKIAAIKVRVSRRRNFGFRILDFGLNFSKFKHFQGLKIRNPQYAFRN